VADKEQFYSFEEALKELRLKEEELKRLVSEGEIRAFREGDTMRLRRTDVETLRSELTGGEVVDLGDVQEDLVFEDDVELAEDAGLATQEIGMATEEIGGVETVIEEVVEEEEVLEDEDAPAGRRAAPVARVVVVEEPETYEGAGLRIALVLTSLVLILGLPLVLAISTGKVNAVAGMLSGLFH
jgi:excisionase family DNA binding protein